MIGPCGSDYGPHVLACYGPDGKLTTTDAEPADTLARDVLVHWALPLLARARRLADDYADASTSAELLADDIAALIGHGVTDQPPADELAEVLAGADLPPVRRVPAGASRLGTPGHFHQAREIARSAARRDTTAAAGPCLACTRVDGRAYCGGPSDGPCADPARAGMGWPDTHPVHAPTPPGGKSGESAPRTPLPEAFGPRADRCPTCGHRP